MALNSFLILQGRRPVGKGQMKALPLLSFVLIYCYSALFFSAIARAMPLKNALTSLKFLSKDGREVNFMRVSTLIYRFLRSNTILAVGFNLQLKGPKARRPRGLKGWPQARPSGRSPQRAEQTCEPCKGPAAEGGRPQNKKSQVL
ncbi:hypothetical protein SGRA_3713 [Saprospira grandis str. Lewin]|uniref:Uncharacterized protein n=1 Tax=Saprospira grandis (strain Lewin) TaxID=984262 RepID=H6L6Z9_SAPGL|nr:hypothetical protein SGRA_3713 [Saprospira grandis str. Lewin]